MKAQANPIATRTKVLSITIAAIIALSLFPAFPKKAGALADPSSIVNMPTGATGMILPRDKSGDTSEWIEIATNGDYSMILRRDVLPIGQVYFDSRSIDAYQISYVRDVVNNWYNKTLPSNARLREFATTSNALTDIGYFAVISNGFSKPTGLPAPTGNDVAILLSFAEAAMFCSDQYATNYAGTSWTASPPIAKANYKLINKSTKALDDFWWLRSPGHYYSVAKCASSVGSHTTPLAGCVYASSSQAAYPYVRPAMWVNTDVFYDKGTINLRYLDADTLEPLDDDESFELLAGNYGPIPAKTFRFYLPAVVDPDGDPAEGVLGIREEKFITFLYTRGNAGVVVSHIDLVNFSTLGMDPYTIPAGDYGPYEPIEIPGYGKGELLPGSDPPEGVLDIGEVAYIYYGYQKVTRTINILYLTIDGLQLYEETFTVPLGHYGLYLPYLFAGYEPGVWDDSSDPPEGMMTEDDTILTIVFLYTPR